jgi:hypothetical protein
MALETLNTTAPDEETPVKAPLATGTPVAAKGAYALPTSKSLVGVDQNLLENMQKMIAEREQQKGSFLESMKDATAWWSGGMAGPGEALARRAKEREEQEATTFGMKSQIAQYNAQQQAAQRKRDTVLAAVGGGGGAPGTGGVGAGGMSTQVDPAIANQVRTMAQSDPAAAEKFLNDHLKKMAEITAAARLNKDSYAKNIEVRTANGKIENVSLMELLSNPAKYQPTEAGAPIVEQLTGGVIPSTGARAPMGSAAKTATDLGVAIISGDRDFAKQSQLYAASQQPGYRGPPVAKPGFSKHETGNAIDVDPARFTDADRQKLVAAGFKQTVNNDPNHWELVSTPATAAAPAAAPAARAPTNLAPPTFRPPPPIQPLPKLELPDRPDNFPVVAGEEKAAVPMAPAPVAAPAAPVAPRAPAVNVAQKTIPELRAEQRAADEFQVAAAKGQAENIVKDEAAFRTTTEPKSVAERKTSAERVVSLVEQNPKAVGVIAKPGVLNALATIARDGLNTPSGAVGIKTIEDALVLSMPGTTQQIVNARKEIAQNLARGALEASKLSQGQGSVSDFERSMFEKIAGSLADTPELLIKRQKMLLARADLDQKTGTLYRSSKAPGRAADFETFTTSPAYVKAVNDYEEKLRSILGSDIVLGKPGAAPAIPKYDAQKEARYQQWKQSQGIKQ